MRILAIDPGEKHIGIALSDPTGTIASPLTVLRHTSRMMDAAEIANLSLQHDVTLILVGKSMDDDGSPTLQSRRADRLAEAIRQQCDLPITFWDESFSTNEARQARIAMGTTHKKRHGHMDDLAATVLLQDYLNHQAKPQ